MILHEVISEILEISDFEKFGEISCESHFYSCNIANLVSEGPLNKMVPLTEDHGGCMGTPVSSRTNVLNMGLLYGSADSKDSCIAQTRPC